MKTSDWNDPLLREIGAKFDAYDLASELETYGADASVLLLPEAEQRRLAGERPREVCIPTTFADALMALLLSLPRRHIGRPRNWSPYAVRSSMLRGMSLRAAAKTESERTHKPAEDIERAFRLWRAGEAKKNKKPSKKNTPR
jgi:hypothetical protein